MRHTFIISMIEYLKILSQIKGILINLNCCMDNYVVPG